jgi:hypothetical protein
MANLEHAEPEQQQPSCSDCPYCFPAETNVPNLGAQALQCRRSPPTVVSLTVRTQSVVAGAGPQQGIQFVGVHPPVPPEHVCGEHPRWNQ